jgi:hypothetical protein
LPKIPKIKALKLDFANTYGIYFFMAFGWNGSRVLLPPVRLEIVVMPVSRGTPGESTGKIADKVPWPDTELLLVSLQILTHTKVLVTNVAEFTIRIIWIVVLVVVVILISPGPVVWDLGGQSSSFASTRTSGSDRHPLLSGYQIKNPSSDFIKYFKKIL